MTALIPIPATLLRNGEWYIITCVECGVETIFRRSWPGCEDLKYCEHINGYWHEQGQHGSSCRVVATARTPTNTKGFSMMNWGLSWQRVACPKCGAQRGERCRTLTTGRTTDSHEVRQTLAASGA